MRVNGFKIKPRANLSGADLSKVNLAGARLRNADLSGADLTYSRLGTANLRFANLAGAILPVATLRRANLRGVQIYEKLTLGRPECEMRTCLVQT
jgi:uncharacterized protein YjbI with pentapeptide repeats